MKLPSEVRRGWEHRFPDLFGKWTHWKILGDDCCLAVVDGSQLAEAIQIVEDNYGRFSSIKAWRATVDADGTLLEEDDKSVYEISNYRVDEKLRSRVAPEEG